VIKKTRNPLEKELNRKIVQWLSITPGVVWFERLNSGKIKTEYGSWIQLCKKGTPDYIALIHDGSIAHTLFIEAKRLGCKQSPEQEWFEEKIITSDIKNVRYIVARDVLSVINAINDITFGNEI